MGSSTDIKNILIVKLNRLGDTVTFLPTIETIRKGYPDACLTVLTTDIGKEVLAGNELADEIWVSGIKDIRTLKGFLLWLNTVKKARFDLAVASSDSSSFVALLFFLADIPKRVGFTNPKLSFLFTDRILFKTDILHGRLNLEIVKKLGLTVRNERPEIKILDSDKKIVLQKLANRGLNDSDKFIIVHLGSNRASRRWPLERFTSLIKCILKTYPKIKVLCVGSTQEKELITFLKTHANEKAIIDMVGETTVKQLAWLLSLSILFIGHSTGPLQIAYTVGIPTVSLWGASSPKIWGPMWEVEKHSIVKANIDCIHCEKVSCPKGHLECMFRITPEQVYEEVHKRLQLLL